MRFFIGRGISFCPVTSALSDLSLSGRIGWVCPPWCLVYPSALHILCPLGLWLKDNHPKNATSVNLFGILFKGTVSSRSEQNFTRAWNRCPSYSLRWTHWLKITGSFMQQQWYYDLCGGIVFSQWVNLKVVHQFHALLIVMILSL